MAYDAAHSPDHFEEIPSDYYISDDPLTQRTRLPNPVEARDDDRAFVRNHEAIPSDGPDDTDITAESENQDPSDSTARVLGKSSIEGNLGSTIDAETKNSILDTFVDVEVALARTAFAQAERLQIVLDAHASDMSEAERTAAQRIIDGLQTTGRAHSANLPLSVVNELSDPASSEDLGKEIEVPPDTSFVSQHELDLAKPDRVADQEVINKGNVITRANQVGVSVRLAAMDMTPTDMKRKQESRIREAPVEKRPNAVYRLTAAFRKEGHPVLQTVSCAYISDRKLERDPDARAWNYGQNVLTHPLTVAATYDGPSLTELSLTWPRKLTLMVAAAELGPAWEQVIATQEGTLLTALIEKIDSPRAFGQDGFINIKFGDQPVLSAGADSNQFHTEPEKGFYKAMRTVTLASTVDRAMARVLKPVTMGFAREVSEYQYDPTADEFRGINEKGKTTTYSVDEVIQLAKDISGFFPLLKAA